jgi:hypothetical protein
LILVAGLPARDLPAGRRAVLRFGVACFFARLLGLCFAREERLVFPAMV